MPITVPQRARADYDLAKAYLCRDTGERRIFAEIARSARHFHLRINDRNNDRFDPNTDDISWDPYSAMRTTNGGTQSPALGLGHELAHAVESPAREERLNDQSVPGYDTAEEERVIRGSERRAARTLGEGVRFDHRGTTYRVATPVSR